MGCLNVKIEYIKNPLNVTTQRNDLIDVGVNYINNQLIVETRLNDLLSIGAIHLNESIYVHINNISSLNTYCYRVCTTHSEYLTVTPNIVWLTPDMLNGEFDIHSNVSWRID